MKNTVKTYLVLAVGLLGLLLGSSCATKKMVVEQIADLDKKVEGVETLVEENQKRIKGHDEKLATIGSLIGRHDDQFKSVDGKIEEIRKASQGKLLFQETVRNKDTRFKFDSFELSPDIKAALDLFVQRLITENKAVYLEIQGHTDSTGPEEWNLLLGKKRADAVLDYLYKNHHIPLHRMQVISFGSTAPVGDNKTSDGRTQNRRVEGLVFELGRSRRKEAARSAKVRQRVLKIKWMKRAPRKPTGRESPERSEYSESRSRNGAPASFILAIRAVS